MFVNKHFLYLGCVACISKSKRCFNAKPLAHFYVKTEISEDFHICISVPLMKERKQPPVVILQPAILQSIFILFLCLRIIGTSDQDVQFTNFPSHIFFNDINHSYRAAILKKNSLWLLLFYGCGYLFLLRKGAQNDAHCNCIKPP